MYDGYTEFKEVKYEDMDRYINLGWKLLFIGQYSYPDGVAHTTYTMGKPESLDGYKNGDRREDGRVYLDGKWVIG